MDDAQPNHPDLNFNIYALVKPKTDEERIAVLQEALRLVDEQLEICQRITALMDSLHR